MSRDPWLRWCLGTSLVVMAGCGSYLPLYGDDPENPAVVAAPGEGSPNSYGCECSCEDEAKTVEFTMVSGLDDAEERKSNGIVSTNDGTLDLVTASNGAPQLVGIAFEGALPRGAEIVSARVQFTAQGATSDAASFTIRAHEATEVAPFTATTRNISDRNLTTAAVDWSNVPAWAAAGDRGEEQRTPELKPILDELVASSWNGSGIVLVFDGSGRRAAWAFDGNPGSAPVLTVEFRANRSAVFPLSVCMPDGLNPNKGNDVPSDAELAADCSGRVADTLNGLAAACGYPACSCEIAPNAIDPTKIAPPRFAATCNETCDPEPVDATCSNFSPVTGTTTATHAGDDEPVCVTHSPLASALFGQRSQCELDGEALVEIEDEDAQRGARGTMMLVGRPCPGASCSVGVELGLDVDDVQFDTLFAEANFVQLSMVGKTLGGLALSSGGIGTLAAGSVESSNHGMRLPEDDGESPETVAWSQRTRAALPVTVDWAGKACTLDGEFATSGDVKITLTGVADVTDRLGGTLVNQPPAADAGDDQLNVECNVQGGARIVLDGGGSTDPDGAGDLASIRWFAGSRSGDEVGYALKAVVSQTGLGANGTWVLRVVDGGGQSDEDSVTTKVVDTAAPTVLCNTPTPATIIPPDAQHPATFTATASDVCAGALTPTLSSPTCYYFNKTGKRVIRDQCAVTLDGATASISNSGGVGDFISWTASVSDGNGNSDSETCTVQVVKKK